MNTNPDDTALDDSRFDRLVDGELSEQQRRELLSRLDDEAGGWRRCALAFLESQCWKQTLGAIRKEGIRLAPRAATEPGRGISQTEASARDVSGIRRRPRWTQRVGTLMAMAACFLVAFWIGSLVHRSQSVPSGAPAQMASLKALKPPIDETLQTTRSIAGMTPQKSSAANPWRMVTVSSPASSPRGEALRLPAVERDNIDQQWVQSMPPAVPEHVMQAFNRSGYQIEQHRELMPVPLQDGRQLGLPVDNVKVRYVGTDTY